jgi:uncharacterized protein YecE (DUF72 family)
MPGSIRVGIGGWTFAPWRGRFYPTDLPKADELRFASRHVTAIEVNGTFYRTQTPESFARWAAETPDDFVFAVKAARGTTQRAKPSEAAPSIERFLNSGLTELGSKLGPILWQFPGTRKFDPAIAEEFLQLLPPKLGNHRLRHVIEAAHPSFADPAWINLLRQYGGAPVMLERETEPHGDLTTDFVYARLERNDEAAPLGYAEAALGAWAKRFQAWAGGKAVDDLPRIADADKNRPRDCFVFFIAGDKIRAPDAAQAMLARLGNGPREPQQAHSV